MTVFANYRKTKMLYINYSESHQMTKHIFAFYYSILTGF